MSAAAVIAAVLIATTLTGGGEYVSAQTSPSNSLSPVSYGPSAAPASSDCMTNLLNMSDCLSYVMSGSGGGASKPDAACCPELAGLVESSPQCLCYLLGGDTAEQYGIKIDMAKALKLPSVCGVVTPPPSLCSLFGVPVAAPTDGSPVAPTDGSPVPSQNISPDISPGVEPPQGSAGGDSKNEAGPSSYTLTSTLFVLVSVIISLFH